MEYLVVEKRLKRLREVLEKRQKDLIVFADNVKNEHNFSAIIRTCDAVGVLYLYYHHAEGKKAKINEGITQGSHKWVFIEKVDDPVGKVKEFKERGFQIVATWISKDSVDFRSVDYTKPTVIIVGNELQGVSPELAELADKKVVIPMFGMAQSLNVSVATGIILYEAQRQRWEKGMYNRPSLSEEEIKRILRKWAYEDIIKERKRVGGNAKV
ncbi:tRNA (guanosine(18)-2'-O)-methyltransferase TrmH [Aquifex pyrophilus]